MMITESTGEPAPLGMADVVFELTGPDKAALEETKFRAYQDAFHRNGAVPNLHNAAALVAAWNEFADVMGIERI